jgi:hypothetical protein
MRLERLPRSNYHQFLVAKQAGRRLRVSADSTFDSGVRTLRQAVSLHAPNCTLQKCCTLSSMSAPELAPATDFRHMGKRGWRDASRSALVTRSWIAPASTPTASAPGKRLFWNNSRRARAGMGV